MSLRRGFMIDTLDIAQHVQRESMSIVYEPINGLDEVWTEDLTLHDDLLGYRRIITISLNPLPESTAKTIIAALRKPTVTVTFRDPAGTANETINCKPELPRAYQRLTHADGSEWWQIESIVLRERSGTDA